MMTDINATTLQKEIEWLQSIISNRVAGDSRRGLGKKSYSVYDSKEPAFSDNSSPYSDFIKMHNLSFNERALLILALLPHIAPSILTHFASEKFELEGRYKPLMGVTGFNFKGLLPTGLTYLYIMAGNDFQLRLELQRILSSRSILAEQQVISLEPHYKGEPSFSGRIIIAEKFVELFTVGEVDKKYSVKYSFNNESLN
jgi:hypothetical protein